MVGRVHGKRMQGNYIQKTKLVEMHMLQMWTEYGLHKEVDLEWR